MKIKHTPGPWKAHLNHRFSGIAAVVDEARGCLICDVNNPVFGAPLRREQLSGRQIADAELIAAAPELLKAAKEARAALQEFITEEPASEWMAVALLDAAIAKAEGRS